MTEREYFINKFEENFLNLKEKKIAIYGSGVNAKQIIKDYSDYKITCVVDDSAVGQDVGGYAAITFDEFLKMGIEDLIIAAQISSAEAVYERIGGTCKEKNIHLYNVYGKDMHCIHNDIENKQIGYSDLCEDSLGRAIDDHEVISFDFDDVLFTPRYLDYRDFYKDIEKKLEQAGLGITNYAQKILEIKVQNLTKTFKELMEELLQREGMCLDSLNAMWEVVFSVFKENFIPRKPIIEAMKYAISCGKIVGMIVDMPEYNVPQMIVERLLSNEYGVSGYRFIACAAEYGENKQNGLYRSVIEEFGENIYLHIGDELVQDMLVPQVYGMDTFLIKKSTEMFTYMNPELEETLNNNDIKHLMEKHIIEVYNDEYLMCHLEEKRSELKKLSTSLEKKIRFYLKYNMTVSDEYVDYGVEVFDYIDESEKIEKYTRLQFPIFEKPEVSIIIPVYNEFGYTYNCLRSILEHTEKRTYEIIIADDCSTDKICELDKIVSNITILRNKENLRFLLNCNNAASYAKGKYILFLNNDTQVQTDWLNPLVEVIEQHKDVGMVGSKLVYPEGFLQEAGGILWKDGSAWNYGHLQNPNEPEFNYVKEVDYISGASIMIRTSLWKEIGGFDTTFAPAYYEDTDLAFEVRKHGYKVVYQPESVVVHFEGVSNGTDTSSGLKNYQTVNQEKFFQKWKDVLGNEHFENGQDVYLAKDRGQTKKQILVVDHYVPNFDKDAGGRCTYMYMKAFLKLGMKVTFIGDNFASPEPYTTDLNQLGIEVLCGDYYCLHWQEWLQDNLKYFDYVYLQRPHISIKYIDLVKKNSRAKIFYFAHDLHHVRMYRDYLVSGNEEALKESEYWKKIEMELFDKTDVGHVVGSYEQDVMQKIFPDKPIRNIPLYIYDEVPERIEKDFSKRKDIMFVGGFNHIPNIDAVTWFASEVFPEILKIYPDMLWHIVGSNAPEEIKKLANDNIILEGFLSDEELGEMYRNCRMVVVPLRYGAGVKGKIVESAYYQIPVVTTPIGGEGIDDTVGAFIMEEDADKMAKLIENLYIDYKKLQEMSDAGFKLIQKYFTSEAAERVLREDMNLC